MRNHFAAELLRMAQEDPSIYVMTGDLGYGVWDKFAETYPDRFINAGISEEHMTAAAAGLALEGDGVCCCGNGVGRVSGLCIWYRKFPYATLPGADSQ